MACLTVFICDRCGTRTETPREDKVMMLEQSGWGRFLLDASDRSLADRHMHLCGPCGASLREWFYLHPK